MQIGIIREGKVPPDHRVPLTPKQCKALETIYPFVKISVQRSPIRKFTDEEYTHEGIALVDNLHHCDVILGVKEVKIEDLIPNKTFIFFSHTIKKQPYNRNLLCAILEQKIRLIDYELIKDKNHNRLIGFGRYAGIVGCYNAFLTYGLKNKSYELKPANACKDRKEVEVELQKVLLPSDFRAVVSGFGRVGHGAKEILDLLPIKEVSPDEFLHQTFNEAIYCQLESSEYYEHADGHFDKKEFYSDPSGYKSVLSKYIQSANMYIPCHFWDSRAPNLLTQKDFINFDNLKVVADISCDIDGPLACTLRSSKISDPIYGYHPKSGKEIDFMDEEAIAIMAVDNLPCELSKDASEDFGSELLKHVFPKLLYDDPENIIEKASETTFEGTLQADFSYLENYVKGIE